LNKRAHTGPFAFWAAESRGLPEWLTFGGERFIPLHGHWGVV